MAVTRVFDIPEMLEMVLLELPSFDLVRATGINKTFRACVKSSGKLQERLFLKQTPIGSNNCNIEPSVNPAFEQIILRNHAAWNTVPLVQPPAVMYLDEEPSGRLVPGGSHPVQFYLRPEIDLKFEKPITRLRNKGKIASEESWREMHLTDRACKIRVIVNTMPRYTQHLFDLPTDVKMAELIEEVDSKIERDSNFWKGLF